MTNEEKALQLVREYYLIPDSEPEEIIKGTLAYKRCLLYFAWLDLEKAIIDSLPRWIRRWFS